MGSNEGLVIIVHSIQLSIHLRVQCLQDAHCAPQRIRISILTMPKKARNLNYFLITPPNFGTKQFNGLL